MRCERVTLKRGDLKTLTPGSTDPLDRLPRKIRQGIEIKTFLPKLDNGGSSNCKLLPARQPKIIPNSCIPVIHYHVLEKKLVDRNRMLTCLEV